MSEQAAERTGTAGDFVVRAVLRTDVGLVRSENQDFGAYTTSSEEGGSHPGGRLLIVADGMGGHRGGATASRLAVQTLKAQYLGSESVDIAAALREALTRANARVFTEAQANPELRGMGTTMSALAVRKGQAWFAHVGDSRIYLVRGDEIRQLTEDHSLVASMVREGLLTREEAEIHPRRNVLQRSVGVAESVEIDVRGPIDLQLGDTFFICSDGLHGLVKEPELCEIARLSIQEAAELCVHRVLERGAPDNVTVIVARVEPNDGSAGPEENEGDGDAETLTLDSAPFDETARDMPDEGPAAGNPPAEHPAAESAAPEEPLDAGEPVPAADPSLTPEAEAAAPLAASPAAIDAAAVEGEPLAEEESTANAAATPPAPASFSLLWMFIGVVLLGVAGWLLLFR